MSQKDELVKKGLVNGEQAFTGPYGLQVGIAGGCNYECEFCGDFSSRRAEPTKNENLLMLDSDRFFSLVNDAADMGVEQISIVGIGEPFMHRDIMKFVSHVKKNGMRLMITTNGSMLTQSKVEELARLNVDILNISLNAGTQETYTRVHGEGQGRYFTKILDNIQLLTGNTKPWVSLRFVMLPYNIGELELFLETALKLSANEIVLQNCVAPGFAPDLSLSLVEQKTVAKTLLGLRDKGRLDGIKSNADFFISRYGGMAVNGENKKYMGYVVDNDFFRHHPCYAGWTYAMILENGDVRPCCYCGVSLGNINSSSFKDIWFSAGYNNFRRKLIALPKTAMAPQGCHCFNNCGSVVDTIKTMERVKKNRSA
ncbi:hypothetical protein MNBD_NITROSPINAE01-632 [hydrothermal vent metagenome]|uniref:Radical SAM core domain-containing protein n=1 Tax=hydrothermal vent metagenome TaxID=652676 RepID=A0A3B1CAY8_9ZZZZ